MIHVIATIRLVEGKREEFLKAFHELMPKVRAEQGCLEYGPAVEMATPVSTPSADAAKQVVVLEKWSSVEALQAHLQAPHMDAYREQVKDLVQELSLQVLEPA